MKKLNEYYQLLDSLASKNKEELVDSYSDDNVKAICFLAKELLSDEIFPDEVTEDNYIRMIPKLRELMSYWNRELGNRIIAADDQFKKRNIEEAVIILNQFCYNCPSSFYRNIAQEQAKKYKELFGKLREARRLG